MASQPAGGQAQLKAEEQATGNQNTNFLNETGGEVNKMVHGAADIASGATQGAIHLVQGAASGAANLTKGAADAVNNTFGTNTKNPR